MANYNNNIFKVDDEYMTSKDTWKSIEQYIPKDKVVWEAFYGDGKSGDYLRELGCEVIHEPIDFYENNLGDIVISNPPFSDSDKIFERLFELDKPFILLLPIQKYFNKNFTKYKDKNIQLIRPNGRTNYIKNGEISKGVSFISMFYCYKMNLPNDIVWLE